MLKVNHSSIFHPIPTMNPHKHIATKLRLTFGLCDSRVSQQKLSSLHNIAARGGASRSFSYSLNIPNPSPKIPTPPTSRAKLGPVYQQLRCTVRHHSTMPSAIFSPGSEGPVTEAALAKLLPTGGGRWALTADGQGIERSFKFKTFTKTWVCEAQLPSYSVSHIRTVAPFPSYILHGPLVDHQDQ